MNTSEEKCDAMNISITKFLTEYTMLRQAGIPDIHVFNEKLMNQKEYEKKIKDYAKEQVNKPLPQGSPTGKVILQYIEDLFFFKMKSSICLSSNQIFPSIQMLMRNLGSSRM